MDKPLLALTSIPMRECAPSPWTAHFGRAVCFEEQNADLDAVLKDCTVGCWPRAWRRVAADLLSVVLKGNDGAHVGSVRYNGIM